MHKRGGTFYHLPPQQADLLLFLSRSVEEKRMEGSRDLESLVQGRGESMDLVEQGSMYLDLSASKFPDGSSPTPPDQKGKYISKDFFV